MSNVGRNHMKSSVLGRLMGGLLATLGASVSATPIDLSEPTAYRSLKERMLRLAAGTKFEGVRQPNNYVFMRDWEFRRRASRALEGQQIFIFFNGHAEKAVAWVESGGLPVPVPPHPQGVDTSLDRAIDLTGEEYTGDRVTADGKIYMFRFKASEW